MTVIEQWIDARLSEAEDTLIGAYGEPEYEEAYTDLLADIVGPFADRLRGAVSRIEAKDRKIAELEAVIARLGEQAERAYTQGVRDAQAAAGGQ